LIIFQEINPAISAVPVAHSLPEFFPAISAVPVAHSLPEFTLSISNTTPLKRREYSYVPKEKPVPK
jgi:hypothetical protein